jgi:hypothetical protein
MMFVLAGHVMRASSGNSIVLNSLVPGKYATGFLDAPLAVDRLERQVR